MDNKLAPVVKSLVVALEIEAAFDLFIAGSWWPLDSHSVFGDQSLRVDFPRSAEQSIVEYGKDGQTSVWGTVSSIDSPKSLHFTWHPGAAAKQAQRIEVTLQTVENGTEVRLSHSGWEVLGEKAKEVRANYDTGWDFVFTERFGGKAGQ